MDKTIDKYNMRQFLLDFPNQFTRALEFSKGVKVSGDFENIIVTGIGGSTLPGDLVKLCLPDLKLPVIVNRDYDLPKEATKNSLIFISSYSGNTEEPLSVYREARKRGLRMVGFCSGGELERLCKKDGIPYVKYPKEREGFQSRFALGYAFTAMVNVLHNSGLIGNKKKGILKICELLRKESKNIEKQSRSLASKLTGSTPVVYSSEKNRGLAYVWKINFNENSKIPAFYNSFPELNHNEMVGYTNPQGKFHVIVLRDKNDHSRILKRMDITPKVIDSDKTTTETIDLKNETIIPKMFHSIYLAMWTSYHLALEYGIDPTPVEMIEDLKKRMRR